MANARTPRTGVAQKPKEPAPEWVSDAVSNFFIKHDRRLNMPKKDGTGPAGKGAKTGGQKGKCAGAQPKSKPKDGTGQGKGRAGNRSA